MRRTMFLLMVAASPVAAQQQQSADPGATGVGATRAAWQLGHDYLVRAAEQMPESLYAFRPTADVRTFGQLVGHVAGAHYMFCAAAVGDAPRPEDDIEKSKTAKADLVAALKESGTYCQRAYGQSDAAAAGMTKFFGGDRSRMFVLALNATHTWEHYGNVVTYLRIKGMVPPSSQR